MPRRLISSGSPLERAAGYSRAVVDGEFCHVSGTTGYDMSTMEMPDDVGAQAKNALHTIEAALGEAGFRMADIVRITTIITDAAHADILIPVLGEAFGDIRPASTMIVAGLIRPEMKVEIEATAQRRR